VLYTIILTRGAMHDKSASTYSASVILMLSTTINCVSTWLVNTVLIRHYISLTAICYSINQSIIVYFRQNRSIDVLTRKPSYRWQTRATRKPAEIASIRRAYNVVADNIGLSSCV